MAAKHELNNEQKAAAYCVENAVVAAGAGSGKTMVLANRYAWLITEKNLRVNEILCLTFTNKAASQMYQRIYDKLYSISREDSGTKGKRAKEALDDFVHARIQTLDSYSASLVRQCASRYGINPGFTVDQERCYALAHEVSLPFLISHRSNPVMEKLYSEKRPIDIVDSIFTPILCNYSYIERGPDILGGIKEQFRIICDEWEKICGSITKNLNELSSQINEDNELLPDLLPVIKRHESGEINFPGKDQLRNYFDELLKLQAEQCIGFAQAQPLQDSLISALNFIKELSSLKLTRGRKSNNPVKEIITSFFRPVFAEFSSITVFCLQAGLICSLAALIQVLQEQYLGKKRAESILTFSDISRLARTVLLEQGDIRKGEKETFKAIMIDEFQDNNELQKDLLFLLAEKREILSEGIPQAQDLTPGKLFFVGDEKQSIYLFRNADVSVFKKLKSELQSGELPLTINYRSSPDLIGAFNAIFGGSDFDPTGKKPPAQYPSVFIPENCSGQGAIPLYEAAYTPLEAGKTGAGKITICVFDKSDRAAAQGDADAEDKMPGTALSPVENEAWFIAERITQLLGQKNQVGENQYKPEDIAILFRTRAAQRLFEKHLRRLNIPYACEALNNLFYGGLVNDLMSVLRLAAYPMDRAAYAEMLRSPFAGLSLSGLTSCLAVANEHGEQEPFTDEPLPCLSESDRNKYRKGQEVYRYIREKARYGNNSTLVSELWYTLGYRYETLWNYQTSVYMELYDYLFHLAVLADAANQGLAAFTDAIKSKRDSEESITDIEIPLERPGAAGAAGAVQLLTIHKSKGLEFPVVFLCCCDKRSRANQCGDAFDTGNAGIAISPPLPEKISGIAGVRKNFFWENSNSEAKMKQTAELRRLLYVGMTRAEKELYISGCLEIRKHGQGGENPDKNSDKNSIEDFPLLFKNFANYKIENYKKENAVHGDSILNDDSFFGLCLPALASHIPVEGLAAQPSFFTIEEIPDYSGKDSEDKKTQAQHLPNNRQGLNTFIKNTGHFYADAQEVPLPLIPENHFTPSSMGKNELAKSPESDAGAQATNAAGSFSVDAEFSGEDASPVFAAVDAMLKRFAADADENENFSAASFGTIAHACAEALLKGTEPEIPPKLNGFLTPAESATFLDAGKKLALCFIRSPLGKIAASAKTRENEFPFRTLLVDSEKNEIFINGTIDLLFEDGNTVYVVDFKTDSREDPAEHSSQMACYFHAASELLAKPGNKKCRAWLYYLRTGHAVEMSGDSPLKNPG